MALFFICITVNGPVTAIVACCTTIRAFCLPRSRYVVYGQHKAVVLLKNLECFEPFSHSDVVMSPAISSKSSIIALEWYQDDITDSDVEFSGWRHYSRHMASLVNC